MKRLSNKPKKPTVFVIFSPLGFKKARFDGKFAELATLLATS